MAKIGDMKDGSLFKFGSRTCTIDARTWASPMIVSLVDGWGGRQEVFSDKDCEPINMPATPMDLVNFIREYQIRYDERLQQ